MRRAKIFLAYFVAFLLFSLSPLLSDSNYDGYQIIGSIHFTPQAFSVGDKVVCSFRIKYENDLEPFYDETKTIPTNLGYFIEKVELYKRSSKIVDVEIYFIPFYPQIRLPAINLEKITLPEIQVNAFSTPSTKKEETFLLRPQAYLPYTFEIVLFCLLIFLIVVVLVLFSSKKIKPAFIAWLKRRRKKTPYFIVTLTIQSLTRNLRVYEPKKFYTALTDAIRKYLSDTLNFDFYSLTGKEIQTKIEESLDDKRVAQNIFDIFENADKVKFGNFQSSHFQQKSHLLLLRRMIIIIEREIKLKKEMQKSKERKNEHSSS